MLMSVEKLKLVAYAPNGLYDPLVGHAVKLLAKSLDVYVNGSGVAEVVKAPYLIKKLVACEYAVVIGCEEVEEFKLLGGNINALRPLC